MPKPSLMKLNKICHQYTLAKGRKVDVLDNIELDIDSKQIIAFLGPSGCGKTTLLKIMSGLISPTSGEILIKGKKNNRDDFSLGLVFQQPTLLPWYTVHDNVSVGLKPLGLTKKEIEVRTEETIELVGLGGFEDVYPQELSGGLKQRVGLAQALAIRPELLCLDEPFSALDGLTAEELRAEVIDLWEKKNSTVGTVVLVTHDIDEAAFMAQKIFIFGTQPGHIRKVIHNPLPYPRDENLKKYQDIVREIHLTITEALIPEEGISKQQPRTGPSWYKRLENIPAVLPGEILGLLEVLHTSEDKKMDIFELANETESEFGQCLAVVKTAELLGFVDTPRQEVLLTPFGEELITAEGAVRKELFSEQVKRLQIFQIIIHWLEQDEEVSKDQIIEKLLTYFPNENMDKLFDTIIAFGRYSEILTYKANLKVLTLYTEEEEEEEDTPID